MEMGPLAARTKAFGSRCVPPAPVAELSPLPFSEMPPPVPVAAMTMPKVLPPHRNVPQALPELVPPLASPNKVMAVVLVAVDRIWVYPAILVSIPLLAPDPVPTATPSISIVPVPELIVLPEYSRMPSLLLPVPSEVA